MAFSIFKRDRPRSGRVTQEEIVCADICEAASEFQMRTLAFDSCVNLIAGSMGRVEWKTYAEGKETKGDEYWLWNVEPNDRQNATEFFHELVTKLYTENEVLIVGARSSRDSRMIIADDWDDPEKETPGKPYVFTNVRIGDEVRSRVSGKDAMYIRLNHTNIKPVIDSIGSAYGRLVGAAMRYYEYHGGEHWKVHVEQLAQGDKDWVQTFQMMLEKQVKPFLNSSTAILPEFDGYKYERIGASGQEKRDTRDITALFDDICAFTARALQIPPVLLKGDTESTENAKNAYLTNCVDPLCDQIAEEATRTRYGRELWKKGSYIAADSSCITHFDMFANAASVDKLVGSGVFSINDILSAAGRPTIDEEWANRHYITLNYSAVTAQNINSAQKGGENA